MTAADLAHRYGVPLAAAETAIRRGLVRTYIEAARTASTPARAFCEALEVPALHVTPEALARFRASARRAVLAQLDRTAPAQFEDPMTTAPHDRRKSP